MPNHDLAPECRRQYTQKDKGATDNEALIFRFAGPSVYSPMGVLFCSFHFLAAALFSPNRCCIFHSLVALFTSARCIMFFLVSLAVSSTISRCIMLVHYCRTHFVMFVVVLVYCARYTRQVIFRCLYIHEWESSKSVHVAFLNASTMSLRIETYPRGRLPT
ncbi:uncharacterized protein EDB93DRAFT_469140 [Suillus bovinus]|uniref:uncharacterized protein n=1 Tax=Suillus bovinus TaxID=48563 RepID=UPI001B868258|nr:uncharacterized protein EDB93DRAFT_469140 [Suillus bovinus]KAG2125073.1 hypothetical protein EDB93DRAFT_469140 [Suillus bovinus]